LSWKSWCSRSSSSSGRSRAYSTLLPNGRPAVHVLAARTMGRWFPSTELRARGGIQAKGPAMDSGPGRRGVGGRVPPAAELGTDPGPNTADNFLGGDPRRESPRAGLEDGQVDRGRKSDGGLRSSCGLGTVDGENIIQFYRASAAPRLSVQPDPLPRQTRPTSGPQNPDSKIARTSSKYIVVGDAVLGGARSEVILGRA